ncbi:MULTISPECIES: ATP-dependent DNA ligase [unclassified Frondihabitans]|uniref:ATP-dependent DNA ligase n=1 Tax=unclassified Frondihabitans TaxID=2626248 RepID=UPI000F4E85CF|nr:MULTISPECIES: ATP-dependent DNA ligase [unclassified Frondihabitans]RPE76531.1 ATP-dependent DNA ligase LigD ligase module /ATP-dependent DNA ligase LigD phosphoesterase module /ATP-dependent DNA ligase LigD polymerase module [Frondihabitans sp. PhB153]RPF05194.1 ATP-dependent DNA ligase LigD ligase module /ATP-dependent DNA ligase LigD phosphoesterase module /ATP-dependent DNA ligase LigD polymerase module [Frondihabitans sp. PhB161]
MAGKGRSDRVSVGGHTLQLTNLDKVLYPATGTTKADVIGYYAAVAEFLLPHTEGRPATRKRWVDGVEGPVFFEKNLPDSAPSWVPRHAIEHKDHASVYPMVDDIATLTWLGQVAALEIHVPQWKFGPRGAQRNPDRLVIDLDPGEGVGLAECVVVAHELKKIVEGMGLDLMPVTSGSKGIHLYAALDGKQTAAQVSDVAHELARAMEADHPDLVLSTMGKQDRRGKVLLDWSQNNGNKTTVAPYSLRGRDRPTVAMPRTWRELASKSLRQLEYGDVLKALKRRGDPLAEMSSGTPVPPGELTDDFTNSEHAVAPQASGDRQDRLAKYRSMRDASKTSEPVPASAPESTDGTSFVIQEHHASRLHWDFRLEHDGVLVSWALPKGEPTDPKQNHLAVQTEDHPLEYGTFEGTIAKGEYGAGEVTIWDSGTYELEKWRDGKEVIVVLHGEQRGSRKVALIHTGHGGGKADSNWLIHRMMDEPKDPAPPHSPPRRAAPRTRSTTGPIEPMLASAGTPGDIGTSDEWAYELKWDGIRAIVTVDDGRVTLTSRNGHDLTPSYPEFADLAEQLRDTDGAPVTDAVLDGEIVAVDDKGRPDFGLLQTRMKLTRVRDIERVRSTAPVRILLFDLLRLGDRSLQGDDYDTRRSALEELVEVTRAIDVPPAFEGDLDEAMEFSKKLRLEGVVAKRRDGTYSAGRRSRAWIKLKHHLTQEVVVAGWRPGAGRRANGIGSLLLGIPGDDGLRYVGRVGTGFRDRDLDELLPVFERAARKTSPLAGVPAADARDAHWITPSRVGEVEFAEWTSTGRLRQPSWRGWRPDKDPGDVVLEAPPR